MKRTAILLYPALALAWAATAGLLFLGLRGHGAAAALGATALFSLYFAVLLARWTRRPGRDGWSALPLLAFLAPLGTVLGALLESGGGRPVVFVSTLLIALGVTGAAHLALWLLGRGGGAGRGGGPGGVGPSGAGRVGAGGGAGPAAARPRWLTWALGLWLAAVWLGSTADQIVRFQVFLDSGHPEDTAFLWGCFQSWAAGGPLLSPWAAAWGHTALRHYFGLHFTPVLLPVFALVKLLPRLSTLLVIQNLWLGLGLWAWAREVAAQARGGHGRAGGPGTLWTLAILAACPTVSAALRNELHPLLWALPSLAWLAAAWRRRRRWGFLAAGASLFLFREDLGLVWAAYAALSWLTGRRGRGELFWLLSPLLGLAGAAALVLLAMPRFGAPAPEFFRTVFATPASSFGPFLVWLLAHPGELLGRLLRPAHWLLWLRLAATGLGAPWRTWAWLPGVPLAALFALAARDTALLRADAHYAFVPVLFVASAAFVAAWGWLRERHPRRREAALVLLWALAAAQPLRLHVPSPADLRDPGGARAEVLADLRALDLARSAWVLPQLLTAAPPERAVPAHRLVLDRLDPTRPGLPDAVLLPAGRARAEATRTWRQLSRHYRLTGPVAPGKRWELWRLEARQEDR